MQRLATLTKAVDSNGITASQALKVRWGQVSARLHAELGEDLFNSWFARMEAEELTADKLSHFALSLQSGSGSGPLRQAP